MTGSTHLVAGGIDLVTSVLLVSTDVSTTGGSLVVIIAAFVTFALAIGLAVLVTYHFVQGYRATQRQPMLFLAIGMFLLAAAPMFIRLWFANVAVGTQSTRVFAVAVSELCGLLTLLYVVYDPQS